MKDELGEKVMTKFVGLRAKNYIYVNVIKKLHHTLKHPLMNIISRSLV